MNERTKKQRCKRVLQKGPPSLRPWWQPGGIHVYITETGIAWRNLFHPWAYGPRDTRHLFRHITRPDFHLSWQARLSFNKVTTLCCHGAQSDVEPVTMTSLKG